MIQKIKNIFHLLIAFLANVIFFFPARRLIVIGVTGTDGKTTTASLIYHILRNADKKVGIVSTLGAQIDGVVYDNGFHVTTPSSFGLQRLLRRAVKKKAKYFVLEVTSHAIDQNRIFGIPFKIGVLTNVTYEHLDYHKTYDSYFKTKTLLLKKSKIAIANKDDGTYTFLVDVERLKNPADWITYGLTEGADVNPKTFPFKTKLLGEFNKYNILAAISACQQLKIPDKEIRSAVETYINPVGRADIVYNQDFSVMIDFAHTPNAFDQILRAVRPLFRGRLIHVFGSAGKRDYIKRPMMGEISSQYSDIMILTAEDPRGESVGKISDEIAGGVKERKSEIIKIPDRREAIQAAVNMAGKDDLVIITGKSHEKSMNYTGREEPWDEYETVLNAISLRRSSEPSKK
ncbi:MAG: UDP-N-acetylmuramoyl-L-alanyl-D-glutamate--2,6-diaminopimelate ligase [Candidatus Levybacteria bacterium]|nr:UDP-N-acetylmuramoyl-L-alanyl-D-glutamate--2,6-diaminopimelate ligase [Candidatus Levybacteria bacterium]